MTLSTNVDIANYELGLEDLDAVAGGSIFGKIVHFVEKEVNAVANDVGKVVSWLERHPPVLNPTTMAVGAIREA